MTGDNTRIRQHLKMSGASFRVDETYLKVGKTCKYLYRAVEKEGAAIEFMLGAKRDVCGGETTLQEDDEGRASPPSVLDQRR